MDKSGEPRTPRPRISNEKRGSVPVPDPMAFVKNKSSDKVRVIRSILEKIEVELCFEKHYLDREQHGDDSGERRGIERGKVEELVLRSVKHLMFYGAFLPNFQFLNHLEAGCVHNTQAIRIVCREETDEGVLNVVFEAHYIRLDKYEVTVRTAMCVDDFRIADNQYVLEIDGNNSTLKKMVNKKLNEIFTI